MQKYQIWSLVGCGSGCALILLGGLLGWVGFPAIVESEVASTVQLKNGTESWDRWVELPLPMTFNITIFSVKNPEDVTKGEKPEFDILGPYVWYENRTKEVKSYNETADEIEYTSIPSFAFQKDLSAGLDTDEITVVNIPLISFAQISENMPSLAGSIKAFNEGVLKLWEHQEGETIFVKTTVHDYIFGGLEMKCNFTMSLNNIGVLLLCAAYKVVAPRTVTIGENGINTFSFFGYKNNKDDGVYTISGGFSDVTKIGQISQWEGEDHVDNWGADSCNKIEGTDSTIFRPALDDVEELYVFNTDLCRTIRLTYDSDTEYRGIDGRRYVASKDVFASVVNNPDNYCYCPQTVNNLTARNGCLKDGILELSSCQGAPVILSHPYYLYGDDSYQSVYDFKPSVEDHQIYLDLETYTGTPLRGSSRVQMNVNLKPIAEVEMMKNFKGYMMPVLLMEEGVQLNDEMIDMLNDEIINILNILNIVRWVIVAVGIAVLLGSAAFYFYRRTKH